MFRKLVTALVLVPLAIVFVAFAVANRQAVVVSFDPFDHVHPALTRYGGRRFAGKNMRHSRRPSLSKTGPLKVCPCFAN